MPTLKDILVKQAAVPGALEGRLPAGAPRFSEMLATVAGGLPVNPSLPELPMAPGGAGGVLPKVPDLIKGVEGMLPPLPTSPEVGIPTPTPVAARAGITTPSGYRPISGAKALPQMGGGYRSIT